jgi:hypothetical protein
MKITPIENISMKNSVLIIGLLISLFSCGNDTPDTPDSSDVIKCINNSFNEFNVKHKKDYFEDIYVVNGIKIYHDKYKHIDSRTHKGLTVSFLENDKYVKIRLSEEEQHDLLKIIRNWKTKKANEVRARFMRKCNN